jgi:hypothetical protein
MDSLNELLSCLGLNRVDPRTINVCLCGVRGVERDVVAGSIEGTEKGCSGGC